VQNFWIFLRSRHAHQQGKISEQSARLSTYSMTALTMNKRTHVVVCCSVLQCVAIQCVENRTDYA